MSTILKADASGAVILPAEICRAAGVTPGADLVAEVQNGRIVLGPARPPGGRQANGSAGRIGGKIGEKREQTGPAADKKRARLSDGGIGPCDPTGT